MPTPEAQEMILSIPESSWSGTYGRGCGVSGTICDRQLWEKKRSRNHQIDGHRNRVDSLLDLEL